MTKLIFHITEDLAKSLTWEDYESLEMAQEGEVKMYRLRPLVARFMVDEENKPLPQEKALKILGSVSIAEVPNVIKLFMGALKDKAVPKENGTSSPSESTTAVESPDGVIPLQ